MDARDLQHSSPNSTPARENLDAAQAEVQRATVRLAAPPAVAIPVVRVRALTESLNFVKSVWAMSQLSIFRKTAFSLRQPDPDPPSQ